MMSSPPLPRISLSPAASVEVVDVAAATPTIVPLESLPEADIFETVRKDLVLVAVFVELVPSAPVTSSVCWFPFASVPVMVNFRPRCQQHL